MSTVMTAVLRAPFRSLVVSAALASSAGSVAAQGTSATIALPIDPAGSYAGPFGPAPDGAERFAQTFTRPAAGFDFLRGFTFYLGDFGPDGSGANLRFRAGIFTVDGNTLGQQLFLSEERIGSAAYPSFDTYTFTTPGLRLDPTVTRFAILLQATGMQNAGTNAIAGSAASYGGGAFYLVDENDYLIPLSQVPEMAFSATFDVAPTATVPEPGSVVLLAAGLAGVGVLGRRRRVG